MTPKLIDKDSKRDSIIDAAIKLFAKKGFTKTTINDIALAAGIGKGTVYEYFSTKEEIIHHSFGYFIKSLELDFQEILIMNTAVQEKLSLIFKGFVEFISTDSLGIIEIMFDFWAEAIKNKAAKGLLYQDMRQFYQSYREIFIDLLREGIEKGEFKKEIDTNSVASLIVGMLDGILVQWILDKKRINLEALNKMSDYVILDGLKREE
jgi:AcrR family transcriptional regulator